MAHKTLIGGTAYEIKGGKTLVGGTAYEIKGGKTLVGGTGYELSFLTGTPVSSLSVGSIVKMNVNGTTRDFIVVNQGKPSSTYDDSCNGTWLLMKDIYEKRQWHSSASKNYSASTIHTYLNGTFLNLFDADVKAVIKQVNIPYSGGLSTKIFLLSSYELGFTTSTTNTDTVSISADGAKLSYFASGQGASANNKRVAYINGSAYVWWTRTANIRINGQTMYIADYGGTASADCKFSYGIRPALILSSDACVDDNFNVIA